MFRKWWITMIQGILLCILAMYIFRNPGKALVGVSFWFALLILLTGCTGIVGWLLGKTTDRSTLGLIWTVLTILFGAMLLVNPLIMAKSITIICGLWVLLSGCHLLNVGWPIKKESYVGWILVTVGLLSIYAAVMMLLSISSGAAGFATILGMQVLLAGFSHILFSFTIKKIAVKTEHLSEFFETGRKSKIRI